MMVFIGGIAAAFFGIIGILIWFKPFLQLLAGAIPVMLLLGGALAAYLGYDEVKDKLPFFKKKESVFIRDTLATIAAFATLFLPDGNR